ncbi:GPI-anchored CFEM domain protein [Ceratocystis lukuohia]|uniref:GPI-anchored CFEM domain protein n=1 Tax=Ceratocystis lukuohia TaxID=2019550 RepID=A0ABR4MI47_9PEZI
MHSPIFIRAIMAALTIGAVSAADLSTLPACGQTCVSNMLAQATTFGCSSAADTACICVAPAFSSGAKDCTAKSCEAGELPLVDTYISTMCGAVSSSSSSTSSTTPGTSASASTPGADASATSALAPTTDPAAAAGASTTSAPTPATLSSVTGAGVSTDVAQSSSIAGLGTNSTMSTSVIASATSTTSTSSTFGSGMTPTATSSTEDSNTGDSKKSSGLSSAAKAGIGIGVGAVVLAIVAIAGAFLFKRSKRPSEYNDKFSVGPMGASGSQFGYSSTHQRLSDGELKATRYEDMVPRAVPRNQV